MRKLSQSFIEAMNSGFLSEIRQAVIIDKDLDLEIRENYVNIYFKGNSLLNLKEVNSKYYRVLINPRILGKLTNPMCRFNLSATQKIVKATNRGAGKTVQPSNGSISFSTNGT